MKHALLEKQRNALTLCTLESGLLDTYILERVAVAGSRGSSAGLASQATAVFERFCNSRPQAGPVGYRQRLRPLRPDPPPDTGRSLLGV